MKRHPSRRIYGLDLLRGLLRLFLRLLTRLDVRGLEHLPSHGPAILTINHVSWSDVPIIAAFSRGAMATFSAEKWEHAFPINALLNYFGNAIYVQRGEIDRKALQAALAWLQAGGILGLAPEGTRSHDGVLHQARDGVTWLATRSDALIVPFVIWGHENLAADWKRLRRPRVCVRVGQPFHLPPEAAQARSRDLGIYTEQIMHHLAALLPPERRGPYA